MRHLWWLLRLLGAAVLFALMAMTAADVVGRYFFNRPIYGTFELTELMLASVVFLALPSVTQAREHVVVDLFDNWFKGPWLLLRNGANVVIELFVYIAMGAGLWHRASEAARLGDQTSGLHLPLAPLIYLMAAMLFAAALVRAVDVIDRWRAA